MCKLHHIQDLTFGTSKQALTTNLNKVTAVILYNKEGKGYYFEAVPLITEPDAEEICIQYVGNQLTVNYFVLDIKHGS